MHPDAGVVCAERREDRCFLLEKASRMKDANSFSPQRSLDDQHDEGKNQVRSGFSRF